jgi:2-aminobenzoate-CoA ligase
MNANLATSAACPSAQPDHFVHDRLPSAEQCAEMLYTLPWLHIPAQANLVDVLFEKAAAQNLSGNAFLRSDQLTLSYAEAAQQVARVAQVLTEDFALVPGNRVLLRGGNSIAMALAWLGVVKAGLVAVATMPLLRAKELGEVIEKSQVAFALCDASLLDELKLAQAQGATLKTMVAFNAPQQANHWKLLHQKRTATSNLALLLQTMSP